MKTLDVKPEHQEIVRRILREHVPGIEVRVIGSRMNGTARPFSDLDLVVMTDEPMPYDDYWALRDAFTESDLPFRVDVDDWGRASERRRRNSEAHGYLVFDF